LVKWIGLQLDPEGASGDPNKQPSRRATRPGPAGPQLVLVRCQAWSCACVPQNGGRLNSQYLIHTEARFGLITCRSILSGIPQYTDLGRNELCFVRTEPRIYPSPHDSSGLGRPCGEFHTPNLSMTPRRHSLVYIHSTSLLSFEFVALFS
jgi:hypothetical protein